MDKERTDLEKNRNYIELRCKQCKQYIMDYTLSQNDEEIAVQHITIKCHRCKRVIAMKKYTEGIIRKHSENGMFGI